MLSMEEEALIYPVRINKYLAKEGIASRREADKLIAAGKIFINGAKAVLGSKVNQGDVVEYKYTGKYQKET